MGTPSYAAVILETLLKSHTIKALVCQPDKRAGRDMQLKMPATKELLLKSGLEVPILQPQALDADFVDLLKQIQFDIIIVAAFGENTSKRDFKSRTLCKFAYLDIAKISRSKPYTRKHFG